MPRDDRIAVDLDGISKVFQTDSGPVTALEATRLSVNAGEFVSLIGPSGCGKTTLLRIVGDLEEPSTGTVLVDGMPPGQARRARDIGVVFQSPALLEWRTVEENVGLPAEVFRDDAVLQRVREMIRMVGLAGFERAYPRELSGGMQSRVAIARALTYRPSVLLMDEPFGALDEITRERMQLELLAIWQEARPAVLFVTHSISEAILLSDRVVVMSARPGRVVEDLRVDFGRPREAHLRADPDFVKLEVHLRGVLQATDIAHGDGR
jgi:NitT/TauT family transport system ATP-binding protein